ncbi:MAG TPA: hypothetical protein VN962_07370 [Polyangia bacterium]|nr:hypothetical protein [Polyangia bacterium]
MSVEAAPREPWRRALLLSLPALAFLLGCWPLSDYDVWWHLRTGQLILQAGAVPRQDWFTYTNADRAWIDVYWLYQIGLALLFRLGGATALVVLKAVAGATIVALSSRGRVEGARRDGPLWPWGLAWMPGVVMLSGRLTERPELVSLLLLTSVLVVLARAPARPRLLWLLPALQLAWANCHGFFVLGPLVLAAYAVDWLVDAWRPPARPVDRPPPQIFAAAAVASLLACLANPYGIAPVGLALAQSHKIGGGLYRQTIGELKSTGDFIAAAGIWNPYLLAGFAAFGLGVASFVACARRARLRLFRALLFAAGAVLSWQATRNSALFGIIAVFVTTWNLEDALAARPAPVVERPSRKPARRHRPSPPPPAARRPVANLALVAATGGLALVTVSGGLYAWAGEGRRVGFGERPRWFAHDACAFLARPDMPERMIAYNISQAAVCIAHGAPAHKQFMDPRLELNTQETFERYLDGIRLLARRDADWEAALKIDHARPAELPAILIERGPLGRAAEVLSHDPRWRCVFADDLATVFIPNENAEQHGLPGVPLR